MHGVRRHAVVAMLATGLAACTSPSGPGGATMLPADTYAALDRETCQREGGRYLDAPGRLDTPAFAVEITLPGCLRQGHQGNWRLVHRAALGPQAPEAGARLSPEEASHLVWLAVSDNVPGAEPAVAHDLRALQGRLQAERRAILSRGAMSGATERVRVLGLEVGEIEPDGRCLTYVLVTEQGEAGTGGVAATTGVRMPAHQIIVRTENRVCAGPQGRVAVLILGEGAAGDDRAAAARGAAARAAGARFLRCLSFRG